MNYMFLIYSQETAGGLTAEETDTIIRGHRALMDATARKGILVGYERLKPTSTATTVRMDGDGRYVTMDGPFAETKEQLAGYYILNCADLDEAIEWARQIPTGCRGGAGAVEIRPVAVIPNRVPC